MKKIEENTIMKRHFSCNMDKLRFDLSVKTTERGNPTSFARPPLQYDYQPVNLHEAIITTTNYSKVKEEMTKNIKHVEYG